MRISVIQEQALALVAGKIPMVTHVINVSRVSTATLVSILTYLADLVLVQERKIQIIRMPNDAHWSLTRRMLFANVKKVTQVRLLQ